MARKTRVVTGLVFCVALLLPAAQPAHGAHPRVSFPELVHTADIIFVGTVAETTARFGADGKMIFTDVVFRPIDLIHKRASVSEKSSEVVTLTFAGGQIGDRGMSVSGIPRFTVGQRHLLFALHDGQTYANPLIGGMQGLFRLIADPQTAIEYPLTIGGAGITAVTGGELQLTSRIEGIEGGVVSWAPREATMAPAPQPAAGQTPAVSRDLSEPAAVFNLEELIAEVRQALDEPPPSQPVLRGSRSLAGTADHGGLQAKAPLDGPLATATAGQGQVPTAPIFELPLGKQRESDGHMAPVSRIPRTWQPDPFPIADTGECREASPSRGTPLCYCGYHYLFLIMEQVPTTWWSFSHNDNAMWQWNQFMDVYRYTADDGYWGYNGENEFGGWPSDAELYSMWGFHWGTGLAMTLQAWSGAVCAVIDEVDVVFNPAYSWWENLSDTLGYSGRILYRPVLMHELGHTWGMQRGSCVEDYSYDTPSVMHAYYSNIVEDGWGIHYWDAYAIRRLYDNQTSVITRKDVGVESYYASAGLWNATTDRSLYTVGDSITINNFTVENMSNSAISDLRFRLWLSSNNIISEGDYQMNGYWYWSSFGAESYWTGNTATTVPAVPAGTYHVGIIATTDGAAYSWDDLSFNNSTFLPATIQVCATDGYETSGSSGTDDACFGALIGLDSPQSHLHCDEDWVFFEVIGGATYEIETSNLIGGADTVLDLYSNCTTWLASNDDYGGSLASKITWTAASDGYLDVRIREYADSYQPGLGYDITVRSNLIFADGFESGTTNAWSRSVP